MTMYRWISARTAFLTIAVFAAATLVGAPEAAAGDWSTVFADQAVLAADLSDDCVWLVQASDADGQLETKAYRLYARRGADGGWDCGTEGDDIRTFLHLDSALAMTSNKQDIVSALLAKQYGFDTLVWHVDGGKAVQNLSLTGVAEKARTVKIDGNTTFNDALLYQFRALILANRTDTLKFSVVMGNQKVDAQVSFKRTADPLGSVSGFSYPDAMRQALADGDYIITDFHLRALFALVYPHHFYLVFEADGAKKLVASWGGKTSEAAYQWRRR